MLSMHFIHQRIDHCSVFINIYADISAVFCVKTFLSEEVCKWQSNLNTNRCLLSDKQLKSSQRCCIFRAVCLIGRWIKQGHEASEFTDPKIKCILPHTRVSLLLFLCDILSVYTKCVSSFYTFGYLRVCMKWTYWQQN